MSSPSYCPTCGGNVGLNEEGACTNCGGNTLPKSADETANAEPSLTTEEA